MHETFVDSRRIGSLLFLSDKSSCNPIHRDEVAPAEAPSKLLYFSVGYIYHYKILNIVTPFSIVK